MTIGQNAIGANFDQAHDDARFELGTMLWGQGGKCYVYCQAGTGGVTGDGYVVTIDEAFEAVMLTSSNDALGDKVGVAEVAVAEDQYFWAQVYGPCGVRTEQDALANNRMAATSDAGQVDDGGAAGTLYIHGMIVGTATGGADAVNATGSLNWAHISTVPAVA